MLLSICAVRDAKSDQYGNPFFMQSIGTAIRSFDDEVNRAEENNAMYRHPEDFSLWHLGEYETKDATFKIMTAPKMLIQADQVKKGQDNKISKV